MERLEPVLKQKFWILLGVGMLMTIVGWWMATASMASAIAERKTKIEAAEKSVPKDDVPNESWSKRLAVVNATQESSIKVTQVGLWKRQLAKMSLPEGLDPHLEFNAKIPNIQRELFRDGYIGEVRQVWKKLNPMDFDGSGIVAYPFGKMFKVLGKNSWRDAPPDTEEIWTLMEDLWLLEGLFQSLATVNGGREANRSDACIHQIDKLELRGGGEKPQNGGPGGGGGGADGGMFAGMSAVMASQNASKRQPGLEGGGGAGMSAISAEFDPREEFGDDGSGAAGGGGAQGGMSMGSMMSMMGGGDAASGTAEKTVNRYMVSADPKLPYRTRGFYLSVKMDHRKIPQLIAELTANEMSVWPVEVLRVQMSRINEDDSAGSAGMGGTRGMSGMGGMADAMRMSQSSSMGSSGALASAGSGNDDAFGAGSFGAGGSTSANSPQELAAKASLENALRDPCMAQVTLCGVFILYNKVVEEAVEVKPNSTTPENPDESANPEAKSSVAGDEIGTESDAPPGTAATMDSEEPAEPVDDSGDKPEEPAAKSENDEK